MESLIVEPTPETGAAHDTKTSHDKPVATGAPVMDAAEGGRVGLPLLLEEEEEEQGSGEMV